MSKKDMFVLGAIVLALIGLIIWFDYDATHAPSDLVNRYGSDEVEYQSPFDTVTGGATTVQEKENIDAIK